jgi:hypothetical protein
VRKLVFVVVLFIAAVVFVVGVALLCAAAAFMVGAVLFAALGWWALSDDDEADE